MLVYQPVTLTIDSAISGIRTYASRFSNSVISHPEEAPYPNGVSAEDFPPSGHYFETYKFIRENLGWPISVSGIVQDLSIFRFDPEYHMEESPRAMLYPYEIFASSVNQSLVNYTTQVNDLMVNKLWRPGAPDDDNSIIHTVNIAFGTLETYRVINHRLGFIPQVRFFAVNQTVNLVPGLTLRQEIFPHIDVFIDVADPLSTIVLVSRDVLFGGQRSPLPECTVYLF